LTLALINGTLGGNYTDGRSQYLTGISDLPRLVIVPVANLVLHEHHDDQRTPPLIDKLRARGVLRNPPVVIPLARKTGDFMVLDGANRVSAFQMSGIPHILVQILEADDSRMDLNAWNHVVWGISPDDLYNALRKVPGVILQPSTQSLSFQDLMDLRSLVSIQLPNGKVFTAFTSTVDLIGRVRALNEVVARYLEIGSVDRTSMYHIQPLLTLYYDLAGLIMLPPFRVTEVMDVVEAGYLMPPGSTRFTIAPRVLHVNYPLSELESGKSIDEKNANLQEFICNCLAQKCVRYYSEPTFLFDE
jgi:hypothetical protein